MKKLPVLQITKDAYMFTFKKTKEISPMFFQYSVSMLLIYVFLHLINDQLAFTTGTAPSPTVTLILLTYILLTFFLQMPTTISMVRATARDEEIGKDFFNFLLKHRTRKVFLTMLAVIGVSSALSIPLILILTLPIIFFSSHLQENVFSFNFVLLVAIIPTIYAFLRLFLAVPSAALDEEKPIRHSWKIVKGQVLRILGIFFLTCVPSFIWGFIINIVFNVSFQTNPLAYGFLTLPQLYFGLILYAGLGLVYKHLQK